MELYGLIGYPLGHSFSKKYFTEKFEKEGLTNCAFELFPIADINEFPQLLKDNPHLKGICVTIPYKEQVLKFVTQLSEEVRHIGATNSIKVMGNELVAYNTDITGFHQSFSKLLPSQHKKALVLGTGGASKAVQYVLGKMGIEFLLVTRAANLQPGFIQYESIDETIMRDYSIIINCSPVGMSPNEDNCPAIPYELLTPNHYLYDLVYKPAKTLFLQKGAAQGAVVENGYEMLLIQAEASWSIWNNEPVIL